MAASQIFVDDSRVGQGVAFVAALVKSSAAITHNTEGKVAFVDASGTYSELKAIVKAITVASNAGLLGSNAWDVAATLQWLDVCGKPDVNRVELLDRLNAALADSAFLAAPLVTIADYLMYFMVHPVVSRRPKAQLSGVPNLCRWFDQIQHDSGVRALGDAPALVVIDKPAPTLVAPQKKGAKSVPDAAAAAKPATATPAPKEPAAAPQPPASGADDGEAAAGVKKTRADKKAEKQAKKATEPAVAAASTAAAGDAEGGSNLSKCLFKVGRVLKCWKHEKADKLLVEEIDLGEGAPRTICSGLVGFYTPEAMVGQLVIVAANLKPRPMSGIESNGMVVCASNEAHTAVELLQPPEGALPGERVMFAGHEGEPAAPNQMAKKKILDDVLPKMRTTADCVATYDGIPFMTSSGPVKCATLSDSRVG